MTDIPTEAGWADGISFLARLYLLKDEQPFALKLGYEDPDPEDPGVRRPDTLMATGSAQASTLLLRFDGRSADRLHFEISRYDENAHLNVFGEGDVKTGGGKGKPFMLEPLEWSEGSVRFRLYDSEGRAVRSRPIPRSRIFNVDGQQLSIATGDVAQFLLKRC